MAYFDFGNSKNGASLPIRRKSSSGSDSGFTCLFALIFILIAAIIYNFK